ncbi:MAG: hypothetical protein P8J32_02895, partial [bacterium]|nr:hypothetical protein [bacterium]
GDFVANFMGFLVPGDNTLRNISRWMDSKFMLQLPLWFCHNLLWPKDLEWVPPIPEIDEWADPDGRGYDYTMQVGREMLEVVQRLWWAMFYEDEYTRAQLEGLGWDMAKAQRTVLTEIPVELLNGLKGDPDIMSKLLPPGVTQTKPKKNND